MVIDEFHLSLFNLLENIIYIYKLDKNEKDVLFINKKTKDILGIKEEKEIFNTDIPVDKFFKDFSLKEEDLSTDNEFIEYFDKKYLVTRSFSIYNNEEVVLCICNDVTNAPKLPEKIKILNADDLLIESIKLLGKEEDILESIYKIMIMISDFYSSKKIYICENLSDNNAKGTCYKWSNISKSRENFSNENVFYDIEEWNKIIKDEIILTIDNIETLKNVWPQKYTELKSRNTKNLVISSIKFLNKPLGFICLENISEIHDKKEYIILNSLVDFILNEMKRKKISKKLDFLSYHDYKTGLFNRIKYTYYIENSKFHEINTIGIAILDINGLNQINNIMGKDFGDKVILDVSNILKKFFRLIDIYRLGGDDFAVICENVKKEDFYKKISSVNKYFIDSREHSVSIGYIWKCKDINIQDLIHTASEFMYNAKREFYEAISKGNNHIFCSMATENEADEQKYSITLGFDNELDFSNKNISFKAKQEIFQYKVKKMMDNINYKNLIMFMLDIDNFKAINEMHGYGYGDGILNNINAIINKNIFGKGISYHSHSDIYYFCIETNENEVLEIINKINKEINEHNPNIRITVSYGVYKIENKDISVEEICERVNSAHKIAKKGNIEKVIFYNEKIREEMLETKQIENDMENAIKKFEFKLYLQPKYNSYTEKISGAEALVRWEHSTRGLIFPGKFIPIFEKNGFIVNLDLYMLEEVCKFIKNNDENNIKNVPISVNMSKLNFKIPEFKDNVMAIIKKYGIDPSYVELEITEGLMIEDKEKIIEIINKFKEENLKISIDDFGTGYSSLSILQKIPADILKIDCEFFNNFKKERKGAMIIRNVINLAKDLSLKVVAEGVETKEELEFLKEIGCEFIQGYYFSKPISIEEFRKKIITEK